MEGRIFLMNKKKLLIQCLACAVISAVFYGLSYIPDEHVINGRKAVIATLSTHYSVSDMIPELDEALFAKAEGWNKNRMGKVELTIFRLAIYEILKDETVPAGVAINEAVELAKKYGQDNSGSFVNGVLAKFTRE